jgi:dTDP-4-amino-4,6-dideoxygalactose transaminase
VGTIARVIPVFRPSVSAAEIDAVADVLRSGWWGSGPVAAEFEERFAARTHAARAIGTSSATAALHLSLVALGVDGGEVVTSALTFAGANHTILHAGARPVFADIEPDTLTLDPVDVARRVGPQTRAILVTDYGGHPADLDALMGIAADHGIPCVEDAAHATGARYRGRPIGSIATATAFSFHAVKNLAMGEGGAVTTQDQELADHIRRLRWFGIDRDTWSRTTDTRYAWDYDVSEIGFKAHLSDVAAAIGLVQLDRLPALDAARRRLVDRYRAGLGDLDWLDLPIERADVQRAWHLFAVRLDDRDRLIDHLAALGIASSVHYRPTHLHAAYRAFATPLPVTEAAWIRLVTLPLFADLSDADQDRVVDAVRSFRPAPRRRSPR